MVSTFDSGFTGRGSSPSQGHCVLFLAKTLHSHSATLLAYGGRTRCTSGSQDLVVLPKRRVDSLFLYS